MNRKPCIYLFTPVVLCTIVLNFIACTKKTDRWSDKKADTVYDTLTTLSQSRIITYKVANSGEHSIYASIDDTKKEITVYLPHYYQLDYLETEISLPEKATISPSPAELVPVFSTSPFTYTVTGKDGSKSTYTVRIIIQQPEIKLTERSTATSTSSININTSTLILTGSNIIPSYSVTSVYLLDKDGNQVYKLQQYNGSETASTSSMPFLFGSDAKDKLAVNTDYWFQVKCYALTYRMQYPVRITK
ncbi:MAG: hypothetical protein QM731_13730 [Chitinophagaceae bacterium]